MAERLPSWRDTLASYPRQVEISPRFADLDPLEHLNNVAIAGIFEEARVRLMMEMFGRNYRIDGVRVVTAEATVRYLAEGSFPEPLTVASGITRVGSSSYGIGQAMFQSGHVIASCDVIHVNTAPGGGASPLPQWMRQRLDALAVTPAPEAREV